MTTKQNQLKVIDKAHSLTIKIYKLTNKFPRVERFRLVDQLCRSTSSVPANIAEGNSRKTKKEFTQFLYQAKGSLAETQYHLLLAKDLGYLSHHLYKSLITETNEIGKMISGLIRYLRK